jgi:hypothetical protein
MCPELSRLDLGYSPLAHTELPGNLLRRAVAFQRTESIHLPRRELGAWMALAWLAPASLVMAIGKAAPFRDGILSIILPRP